MTFPSVGEIFGDYRIVREIGSGGMGVVFEATHVRVQRPVALKVLPPRLANDEQFRERFGREAATLSQLDSPHIVQVVDHGEHDGSLYLVTQLVRGGDLGTRLAAQGPLSPATALALTAQIASALEDAHRAGVVHRDIKPANVLLRDPSSGEEFAYLCDFGIAQADTTSSLTMTGGLVGTWAYLAPERALGHPGSPASDIYSLGCLLWAALGGQAPYAGTDFQVMTAHQSSPPPQLGAGDPSSRTIDAVIARSMAKRPGDRYASAAQMRDDLRSASAAIATAGAVGVASVAAAITELRAAQFPPIAAPRPSQPRPDAAQTVAALRPPDFAAAPPVAPLAVSPASARRRRGPLVFLAALVLLGAAAGGVVVVGGLGSDDSGSDDRSAASGDESLAPARVPTTVTTTPTPEATASTPAASVTTPAEQVAPEPDPLGIGFPQRTVPCNGKYVVVAASAVGSDTPGGLENALSSYPKAGDRRAYLSPSSCSGFWTVEKKGDLAVLPILGVFDDARSACEARTTTADMKTYVMAAVPDITDATYCMCPYDPEELPRLDTVSAGEPSAEDRLWVLELQYLLSGANYSVATTGNYLDQTTAAVGDFQDANNISRSGAMDTPTWAALRTIASCG